MLLKQRQVQFEKSEVLMKVGDIEMIDKCLRLIDCILKFKFALQSARAFFSSKTIETVLYIQVEK